MTYYAAIDLHSNNGVLTVIDENEKILKQKKLPNLLGGFVSELAPYRQELASVAVESTFNWYWLVDGLASVGFPMVLVNTTAIPQYDGLKRADDNTDSFGLARLSLLGILPTASIYPKEERPTRDLLRKRSSFVQQRTANLLSIQNLEQRNRAVRRSTKEIKKLKEEEVDAIYSNTDLSLAIKSTLRIVNALTDQITSIEAQVMKKARLKKEYKLLTTVWGIGEILALTIMYESGTMSRFATVGDFVSYCRLVDAKRFSNGKKKGENNAKNGNAWLSWAFSEAAHFAIRNYPPAKAFYDRKSRQKNRIVALRALAHKLARASFYVLTRQEAFDPKKLFG
jgi:transposase